MKRQNTAAVFIFLGLLLTVCFVVGLTYTRNPSIYLRPDRTNVALEQFAAFCGNCYVFFGLIGIPMLLISLIVSLIRESREK